MTKKSHDVNEKRYLSCAIRLFLIAAAFFMNSEIYQITFEEMFQVSLYR